MSHLATEAIPQPQSPQEALSHGLSPHHEQLLATIDRLSAKQPSNLDPITDGPRPIAVTRENKTLLWRDPEDAITIVSPSEKGFSEPDVRTSVIISHQQTRRTRRPGMPMVSSGQADKVKASTISGRRRQLDSRWTIREYDPVAGTLTSQTSKIEAIPGALPKRDGKPRVYKDVSGKYAAALNRRIER